MDGKRRSIALLFACYFLSGLCFYAPVATLYRQAAGLNLLNISVIESISVGVMLVLEAPWGYLADRLGHRRTIVICFFILTLSKVVFWRAETIWGFLLERLLLAAAGAGLSGCDSAYLFSLTEEGEAQKVYGRWNAWQTAGLLAAGGISSLFLTGKYRLTALLTVFTYLGAAVLTLGLKEPEREVRNARERPNLRAALRQSLRLAPFLLAAALLSETAQFITVFLSQAQYLRSGISERWFGLLYSLVTLVSLLGAASHVLIRRVGEGRGMGFLFLFATVACLGMAAWPLGATSVVGMVALRLAAALFLPLSLALQNREAAHSGVGQATQLSCNAIVMDLVSLFLNPAFGKAAEFGTDRALLLGGLACVVGLAVVFLWRQSKSQRNTDRIRGPHTRQQ